MKNFHYKSKVFFWSGLGMLILAGLVWVISGGAKAALADIQSGRAGNDRNGACSSPGCYSEEWSATEITGDAAGFDNVTGGGNAMAFERLREKTTADQLAAPDEERTYETWYAKNMIPELEQWGSTRIKSVGTDAEGVKYIEWNGNNTGPDDGHLISTNNFAVTRWQINGHVH